MRSGHLRRLDLTYSQLVPRATLVAFLMTDDAPGAARLAVRSFVRSAGSMQDLRGPDVLEADVLRRVVLGARSHPLLRPWLWRRSPGDLRSVWLSLPARTRGVLVLTCVEDMDARRSADVLGCSEGAVTTMRRKGLAAVADHLGHGEPVGLLTDWLLQRAQGAPQPPSGSPRMRRRIGLRRALSVTTMLVMAVLFAAGAFAGTTAALRQAPASPPEAGDEDGPPRDPVLQGIVDELSKGCPDRARLLALPQRAPTKAVKTAVSFNQAIVRGDERTVLGLTEPTAGPTRGTWASTKSARGIVVTNVGRVSPNDLFTIACGRAVTKRSVRVVMYDRNGVTSVGLAFFYVALTTDGWRVWAADEPGA